MAKSLDTKLVEIHANPDTNAFILADAKDADMAFGIAAPGQSPEHIDGQYRSLGEYRDIIRENTRQGLLDIMLMSVSTSEVLTINERLFDNSTVTPAIRANDATDIWVGRSSSVGAEQSRPFATALIDHAQCAQLEGDESLRGIGADLGLYSVTFNNDRDRDAESLAAYKAFRMEAERKGFRHFLEIFDPNAPSAPLPPEKVGPFVNDLVVRALAGVAWPGRPLFLKMVYHGPKWMEELAHYDPHLVPGILGGASGTTYDAFKLLAEAKKYGAKAALFGRRINNSEHQLSFIQFLRWVADGKVTPGGRQGIPRRADHTRHQAVPQPVAGFATHQQRDQLQRVACDYQRAVSRRRPGGQLRAQPSRGDRRSGRPRRSGRQLPHEVRWNPGLRQHDARAATSLSQEAPR